MKQLSLFIILLIFISNCSSVFAANFGYYKSDYEYGLFDSIKINWNAKKENKKFIELRTETQEGKKYLDQQTKSYEGNKLNENEQYRLIRENTVIF